MTLPVPPPQRLGGLPGGEVTAVRFKAVRHRLGGKPEGTMESKAQREQIGRTRVQTTSGLLYQSFKTETTKARKTVLSFIKELVSSRQTSL